MKITKITLAFLALCVLSGCNTTKKIADTGIRTRPTTSVTTAEEGCLAKDFEKNAGNAVWFAYNSSALSTKSQEELVKQACWLSRHPHVKATIEGHCDSRGTREYNLGLGERRAEAARRFLVSKGIDHHRIGIISYGKDKPAMVGENEEAWSYNRRAVTAVHD